MAVYAQTACTLSTITDVTAVYTYYHLAETTITSNMAPKDGINPPDETHDAGSRVVTVTYDGHTYIWRDIDPSLSIVDNVIQNKAVGQLYYIECVKFSNGTYDWGPLMTSSTYAAAKAAYNLSSQALSAATTAAAATALLGGHFIYGSAISGTSTPASARIIEQIEESGADVSNDPSKWHHNVIIGANGINLRYNEVVMAQLAANQNGNNTALKFYQPPTISGSTTTPGNLTMELSGNALKFYDGSASPVVRSQVDNDGLKIYNSSGTLTSTFGDSIALASNGATITIGSTGAGKYNTYINSQGIFLRENTTAYATLDNSGLILSKGGIIVGTAGSNNGVYISSDNLGSTISIGGNKTDWRAVIGSKFGVDSEGNLYANNAHLSGATVEGEITATSLIIGNGSNAYNGEAAINVSGYDIVIYEDSTDSSIIDHENTTYLYPVMYHNGEIDETVDNTHYIWFMDNIEPGTTGDAAKGGIIASYGHSYRVTYDFDDSAVGTGTLVQERIVDPSKYITKISDTGITIHPEFNTNTTSIQLDGTGLDIIKNGVSIAKYSTTARIGQENNSRFLINTNSLQAYSGTDAIPYFEVNANGLTWGSNTAATTTQVDMAAQTATNFIKIDGTGIKVQTSNDTTDYLYINSDKIALYRNNIEKLRLTDSLLRLGDTSSNISIDADGMTIYKNGISIAYYGDTSRIGKLNSAHSVFTSSGMQLWTGQETEPSNQVATFGARSKIGKPTGATMIIAPNSYQDGASNSELIQFRDIIDGEEKVVTKITTDGIWTGLNTDSAELSVGGMTITVSGREYWGGLGFLKGEILNKEQGTSGATASVRLENNFTRDSMHTCSTVLSNYWSGDNYISVDGSRSSYSSSNSGIVTRIHMVTDLIHMDASIVRTNDGVVQSSDRRFKEHLRYLGEDACNFIKQLKPAYFNRKGNKQVGFYAQDIEAIDPWQTFVMTDNEGFKLLNYTALIAPLVTYCQKLEQRIEELEKGD